MKSRIRYPNSSVPIEYGISDSREIPRDRARDLLNWVSTSEQSRCAILIEHYTQATGRTDCNLSPESLVPLWGFFRTLLEEDRLRSKNQVRRGRQVDPHETAPDGATTAFAYDMQGRMTQRTDPDGGHPVRL